LKAVFKDKLDPSAYGGAPLLGLADIAIKCHGSSSSRAIKNGIKVAHTFAAQSVLADLRTALSQLDVKVGSADTDGGSGWSKVFDKKSKRDGDSERSSKGVQGVEHDGK
jgi:hypothetical protein